MARRQSAQTAKRPGTRRRGRPRRSRSSTKTSADQKDSKDTSSRGGAASGEKAPETFLSVYFREMAALSVLKPEEEFRVARDIESMEQRLWSHLLSHPGLLETVLSLVRRDFKEPPRELDALKRQWCRLKQKSTVQVRNRYLELCESCGRQIADGDVDRRTLLCVLAELRCIARGDRSQPGPQRVAVNVRSKSFLSYYKQTHTLFNHSQQVRNEFVKANLRLVVSIARRFNHGRMPLNDLIQEGNIGLIKAVERYDYRRGYRFSTYASWWIRHAISRALADKGRAVRLPVHMLDAHQKVARCHRELSSKLGRPPTIEELGRSTKIAAEKVDKILGYMSDQNLSLDRNVSDGDDRRFVEMLSDPDAVSATDWLMRCSMSDQVHQIMGDLKPIESDVLRKRFGLEGAKEQTLKEIGDIYELSRERIRQIQEQALGKIRRALRQRDVI